MSVIDLSQYAWKMWGWRPYAWRLGKQLNGDRMPSDVGPFSVKVPCTVQQALLNAGVIEDWNVGLQSRSCEWIEHRHWEFAANLPTDLLVNDGPVVLEAESLDYSGWVFVDCEEVGRFEGSALPYRVDLTSALAKPLPEGRKAHELSIIFEEPPREQGQIGYTSRSHFFKSRFNYSWDWCPRIVSVGPFGALRLLTGLESLCTLERLCAQLNPDDTSGTVEVRVAVDTSVPEVSVTVIVRDGDALLIQASALKQHGDVAFTFEADKVKPWYPNGFGEQLLYEVEIQIVDTRTGAVLSLKRSIGFRRVEWIQCDGAPAGAEPWICVVNGKKVFLQGANWVPPRALFADTADREYESLINLYKEMGCTVLRIWGGAILETEVFYNACDRAGILVWQEFPLSSSGIENTPPSDPVAVKLLTRIARHYIQQRNHHASLLMWCGGNELTDDKCIPITYAHPCIAELQKLVEKEDPGRRFVSSSSSGPLFSALSENYGKGLHHDTHGPWGMGPFGTDTFPDLEAWQKYWNGDDSLIRSEVGMPGAMDADAIKRYAGKPEFCWPPTTDNPYWMHTAAWWLQWDRFGKEVAGLQPEEALTKYVALTQKLQADAYRIAAQSCKDRFPKCGGFIIWMGHDCFPCPTNNSIIDFDRHPKPAYFALKKVFTGK